MNATTLLVGRSGHLELRLGQACRDLRKQLGLAAWIALEELVLEAVVERDGTLTVAASARDLAERLGIGKDRAAAALATLRTVRVIVAVNAERDRSSRFVSHTATGSNSPSTVTLAQSHRRGLLCQRQQATC